MGITSATNKRRRTSLIDNVLIRNFIYTTLLTVKYNKEAFTCHVWCKQPLYLKTGAGRNRFNLLGCVDPFSLDIIQSHSMVYVDAE